MHEGKTIYSIEKNGTVCDGYNRADVIREAEEHFANRACEDGYYGAGVTDVKLLTHVWDTGEETEQDLTLTWSSFCNYDPSFDYKAATGQIRSI